MGGRAGHEILETVPSTLNLGAAETVEAVPSSTATTQPPARAPSEGGSRYAWLALLGEGGMGRVERMRDRDLLRDVAIKHLLPELRSNRRLVEQFLWEARVTAHLDHPNIVPVHDLATAADDHLYFTMKLVRGESLEAAIARWREEDHPHARANLNRRLRLLLPVCNAVAFAHSRGVLHRDLKPANVLLGEYGEVLVGDWGLAIPFGERGRELAAIAPSWIAAQSAGTPSYMSPEQVAGEPLDERSDVYTLGVILYELVALRGAFRGASIDEVLSKVKHGEAPPLGAVLPDVSSALAAVVGKAMAVAREDRYPDVRALSEDLETVLDGGTPSAEAASLPTRAARYYVGRDPAMSRLRVIDIDFWALSAFFVGGAASAYLARVTAPYWWGLALAAIVFGAPPTVRWLRLRREQTRRSPRV